MTTNPAQSTRKRVELARALSQALFETGEAFVTDPVPGKDGQLRLEILSGSPLPDVLSERYRLHRAGTSTRIIPNGIETARKDVNGTVHKTTHAGEVLVDVFFLELPSS
jgi:hypothetical protein